MPVLHTVKNPHNMSRYQQRAMSDLEETLAFLSVRISHIIVVMLNSLILRHSLKQYRP